MTMMPYLTVFGLGFLCGLLVGVIVAIVSFWSVKDGTSITSSLSPTEESTEKVTYVQYCGTIIAKRPEQTWPPSPLHTESVRSILD